MIAEYERAQLLERYRRGKRHRTKAGDVVVLGGDPMVIAIFAKCMMFRHVTTLFRKKRKSSSGCMRNTRQRV
ncbi:hypothetical protein XNC3_1920007 [Xenorhabdus nematophila F1]|nr:hypothetical protein XNC3_1920007 [Xenorhabdus nematophila F1]